ncbi:MAG: 30S ribosomal protein S20 [Bacillus sp. (in: firmicutes)]
MPNIKSAIKRVKTADQRRANNIAAKSAMRTAVKNAEVAIANNDENVKEALIAATKKLDKAASKGLIHKNAAARKKSRLAKRLNSLNA